MGGGLLLGFLLIFFAGEMSYVVSKVAYKAIGEETKDKEVYTAQAVLMKDFVDDNSEQYSYNSFFFINETIYHL